MKLLSERLLEYHYIERPHTQECLEIRIPDEVIAEIQALEYAATKYDNDRQYLQQRIIELENEREGGWETQHKAAKYDDFNECMTKLEQVIEQEVMKEIQATGLVEKAANWDLLEKLPDGITFAKHERTIEQWMLNVQDEQLFVEATPAEALRKYWENKQ
jgi:hypothetical protein